MQRWEYKAMRVEYDYSDTKGWVETGKDEKIVGWDAILNAQGQEGWELVGFSPQLTKLKGEDHTHHVVDVFRLVFKRPLPEA